MESRRLAAVSVSVELWCEIIREGWEIPTDKQKRIKCTSGVPVDAVFQRVEYNLARNELQLVFEHDTFALVEPGDPLPILSVTIEAQNELD